jgi:hypothetical protein
MASGPVPFFLDVTVPGVARVYDVFLDGKDNFAADRAVASSYPRWCGCIQNAAVRPRAVPLPMQAGRAISSRPPRSTATGRPRDVG